MNICLVVDPARYWRWHEWLSDDLRSAGHHVEVCRSDETSGWPTGLQSSLRIDQLLHRIRGVHALDRAQSDKLGTVVATNPPYDIVINCSGFTRPRTASLTLTLLFDGEPSELGAISAFLDGRNIDIGIVNEASSQVFAAAAPAIDCRMSITSALDCALSRAIELVVDVVQRRGTAATLNIGALPSPNPPRFETWHKRTALSLRTYRKLSRIVSTKISNRLSRPNSLDGRWAIAIRSCRDQGLIAGEWPHEAEFRIVPDDAKRFFADPMLIEHEGRTWLFCEELPFETRRGLISVAEVGADGSVGPMRPVLERPYHLSYPFVFEDGGRFYMIPESSQNHTVDLYVATDFPHSWRFVRHLLEGFAAHDTTLFRHDGRYVLFTTTLHRMSTSWDNLCVFEAAALDGPFVAQDPGSLLINARQCRSAGAIVERGGDLIRPAQDCSVRYGGAISLNMIDRSKLPVLQQTEVATIAVARPSQIAGPHTYSRSTNFEALDVYGAVDDLSTIALIVRPCEEQSESRSEEQSRAYARTMRG